MEILADAWDGQSVSSHRVDEEESSSKLEYEEVWKILNGDTSSGEEEFRQRFLPLGGDGTLTRHYTVDCGTGYDSSDMPPDLGEDSSESSEEEDGGEPAERTAAASAKAAAHDAREYDTGELAAEVQRQHDEHARQHARRAAMNSGDALARTVQMRDAKEKGKLHGKGTQTRADGTVPEGEFVEGELHGQGRETCADGTARKVGEFAEGELHGKGKMTSPSVHEGEFVGGEPHGQGMLTAAASAKVDERSEPRASAEDHTAPADTPPRTPQEPSAKADEHLEPRASAEDHTAPADTPPRAPSEPSQHVPVLNRAARPTWDRSCPTDNPFCAERCGTRWHVANGGPPRHPLGSNLEWACQTCADKRNKADLLEKKENTDLITRLAALEKALQDEKDARIKDEKDARIKFEKALQDEKDARIKVEAKLSQQMADLNDEEDELPTPLCSPATQAVVRKPADALDPLGQGKRGAVWNLGSNQTTTARGTFRRRLSGPGGMRRAANPSLFEAQTRLAFVFGATHVMCGESLDLRRVALRRKTTV